MAYGDRRNETYLVPVEAKKSGHARRSQTTLPNKQPTYVGHYPLDAYPTLSSKYTRTAITGTANSSLFSLLDAMFASTPASVLRRIVDVIPMLTLQQGAFRYYATSHPRLYLYVIWNGPPGIIHLTPDFTGELLPLHEPHKVGECFTPPSTVSRLIPPIPQGGQEKRARY